MKTEEQYISFNGEIFNAKEPVLSVNNRAFHYGDALFETIRVINGKPCFLQQHLNRIMKGAEKLQINVPENMQEENLYSSMGALLKKNNITQGGRIRMTLFRNEGGYFTPETNDGSCMIEATAHPNNLFVLNEQGWKVDLYEKEKVAINDLSPLKTTNGLFYIIAGLHKKEQGLDECILLNETGNVAETISSNIFLVLNRVLYTPSANQGCIAGVMRQNIIEIAAENKIEVQECPLNPSVLMKADELLLTNSINGIRWIMSYRSKRYFNDMAKLLTEKLNDRITSGG